MKLVIKQMNLNNLSKFFNIQTRLTRTTISILLSLTVTLLSTACTSTSPKKSNELLGKVLSLPSKQLDKSEEQLSSIHIAMSPSQNSQEQQQQRQLLADYLQEQLGLPVNIELPQDYDTAIDLIAGEKVQMAYLGPFSYIKARQRNSQLEPLVAYIDKRTGRPWYTSVLIVNTKSKIKTIDDLKGKRVGFVNRSSTSGYLVPAAYLKNHKINLEKDLTNIQYTGSHNKNVVALESGQVDAIGINKPTYLNARKSGKLLPEQYQVIWESDPIPNAPIVISSQLPPALKSNLQKALINAPQNLAALSGAKSDGYTLVQDDDYEPIRKLQKVLEIDLAE